MKKLTTALASLAAATLLSGSAFAADQKFTFKLSHQMAADHTLQLVALRFSELVKEKTNGNVMVKVFP